MDRVLKALSHATRRRILDLVRADPGLSVGALAEHFDVSRIAVMKHLSVLEEAHLVLSEKDGRSRLLHFNAVPIRTIVDRWTSEYSIRWSGQLTALKYRVENREES